MNIPNYSEALFRGNLNEAFRVKREAIPTKIYKFIPLGISEEADRNKLSTLENDELWFSPISSFNDPYEYMGLHIDNEKLNRAGYGDELISAVHEVLKAIGGQGLVVASQLQTIAQHLCGPITRTGRRGFVSSTTLSILDL